MANYLELTNRWLDLLDQPRQTTLSGATDWAAKGKWLINEALRDIISIRFWRWREKEWVFQTVAPYKTGTITIAAGTLTTVTGASTAWTSSNVTAGLAKIRPTGEDNYYLISTVDSTTSLTLSDSADAAVAAGTAYTIFQDLYNLGSDVGSIRSVRQFGTPLWVPIGRDSLMDEFIPDPSSEGKPRVVLFFSRSSTGLVQVRPYPIPDSKMTIRLKGWRTFTDMSADTDTIGGGVIPTEFENVVVWRAFLDACDSGIADDPAKAARIERRLMVRLGQLIAQDNPDAGKTSQVAAWEPQGQPTPLKWKLDLPVTD